jgi:hypothetical protein
MSEKYIPEEVLGSIASFSQAFGFFLCFLEVLDLYGPQYFFISHKMLLITTYRDGLQLSKILLVLIVPLLVDLRQVYMNNWKYLLLLLPSLVAYPLFGFRISILYLFLTLFFLSLNREDRPDQTIRSGIIILLAFFSMVFLAYVLAPFRLASGFNIFSELEFSLHFLFVPFVPLIICLGLYSWILRPLTERFDLKLNIPQSTYEELVEPLISPKALIFLSIVIGMFTSLFPYSNWVNPDYTLVGADVDTFLSEYEWVREDIWRAFQIREGSRPLFYLVTYCFQILTGLSTLDSIRYLPSLLYPLLVITTYFLSMSLFEDDWIGSFGAFFTATGVQMTVATYSYYQTNVLGLIFQYTSWGLFFRSIKNRRLGYLFLSIILGGLLVFTHPWTFTQFFAVFIILWVTSFLNFPSLSILKFESGLQYLSAYILSLGSIEVFKTLVLHDVGSSSLSSTLFESFSFNPMSWIPSLIGMTVIYGGMMSNGYLFGLSAIGIWRFEPEGDGEKSLWLLLVLSSMVFIVSDEIMKSRLLFNIPFGFFSAIGLKKLMDVKHFQNQKNLFPTLVVVMQLVYLLRSLVHVL